MGPEYATRAIVIESSSPKALCSGFTVLRPPRWVDVSRKGTSCSVDRNPLEYILSTRASRKRRCRLRNASLNLMTGALSVPPPAPLHVICLLTTTPSCAHLWSDCLQPDTNSN